MKNVLREKLPGSLLENIRSHLRKEKNCSQLRAYHCKSWVCIYIYLFIYIYIHIVENHISRAFTTLERSFPDKLEEPSVCWLCNEHSWRAFFRGRDRKIAMFVRRRRGKFGKAVKHLWSVIFALTLHFLFFFRIYPKDTRMNRYIRWNNSFPYRIKYYIMGGRGT